MNQQELFHEDFKAALDHAVKALGGYQAVGAALWPAKTLKAADNWLRDCLNSERNAKFDIDEVVAVMRMARAEGVHSAMHQLCDDLGYERPDLAPTKTKHQQLAEQFERKATELKNLADELAATERNGE